MNSYSQGVRFEMSPTTKRPEGALKETTRKPRKAPRDHHQNTERPPGVPPRDLRRPETISRRLSVKMGLGFRGPRLCIPPSTGHSEPRPKGLPVLAEPFYVGTWGKITFWVRLEPPVLWGNRCVSGGADLCLAPI